MQNTSERLKQIMKDRNLRQVDILEKSKPFQKELNIKMSKSHLSQYVNGRSSPDQHKLFLLSKTLNVGEAWLMGYDVDSYRIPDEERQEETVMSKIRSTASQLTPPRQENVLNYANSQLDEQNSKGYNIVDINSYKQDKTPVNVNGCVSAGVGERLHDETLFTEMVKAPVPPHDLALKVNGDSMEPMFKDGEIIFVEKTHNIKNGQIGIFIIEEEAYVKKVFVEDDRLTLVSLNKKYRDLHFYRNESVRLVGKVIL